MTSAFLRSARLGAVLWLAATIAIRLAGQWVFRPEPAALISVFLIGGVLMALIAPRMRVRVTRDPADADAIALGLILPGMVADAAVALAFRHVYPNLSPALGNDFAALMLWYYAVAALAITVHARLRGGSDAGTDHGRSGGDQRGDHDQGMARPA